MIMTPTERKYRNALGKLYKKRMVAWNSNTFPNNDSTALVMPYQLVKHGGWWHFVCHVLTNRDSVYNPDATMFGCSDFMRKATIISGQPLEVK